MVNLHKQASRKVLPLLGNIGVFGSIAYSIYYALFPELIYYWLGLCFVMMLAGSIAGMMITDYYSKKGVDIVKVKDGRIRMVMQPAYLYALIPFAVLTIIGAISGNTFIHFILGFGIVPAFFFILGIGNGLFDYTEIADRKMLYTAIIPIAVSVFIAFIASPFGFYQDPIWIFGSIYLLFFLLVINRIKIEEMFLMSSKVNIENKKGIRRRNDLLVYIFFTFYLIIFVIRNVFTRMSDWFYRSLFMFMNWVINQFYKVYTDIDVSEVTEAAGQEEYIPELVPPANPILKSIIIVLVSLALVMLLYFIVKKLIQLIKWLFEKISNTTIGGTRVQPRAQNEEFIEIVEDLDEEKQKVRTKRAPKFKYTLAGFKQIESYKEKVRYLYGYALERMKFKKIEISKADTPEQILDRLADIDKGQDFVEDVFDEFTKEYMQVRYSDKQIEDLEHSDINSKATDVDKGIESIKVPYDSKKTRR